MINHVSEEKNPARSLSMRKGPNSDYDKRNISVVICDTNSP